MVPEFRNSELMVFGEEGLKWLVVGEAYQDRVQRELENGEFNGNLDKVMDYLEEHLISYICLVCDGKEVNIYRRFPDD